MEADTAYEKLNTAQANSGGGTAKENRSTAAVKAVLEYE